MILVLGTGRSGTSFTCHVLATELGIYFGDTPAPTRATPHGSYEDRAFYELNHHRRARLIGQKQWRHELAELAVSRAGQYGEAWGLKDPQAAPYTGELIEVLRDPYVIWCDRDPEACAISRCRLATSRPYHAWLAEVVSAHDAIEHAVGRYDHLRLDFDHRWTPAQLIDAVRDHLVKRERVA